MGWSLLWGGAHTTTTQLSLSQTSSHCCTTMGCFGKIRRRWWEGNECGGCVFYQHFSNLIAQLNLPSNYSDRKPHNRAAGFWPAFEICRTWLCSLVVRETKSYYSFNVHVLYVFDFSRGKPSGTVTVIKLWQQRICVHPVTFFKFWK